MSFFGFFKRKGQRLLTVSNDSIIQAIKSIENENEAKKNKSIEDASKIFNEFILQDNIWDAHIVGKNTFCQYPNRQILFDQYFDFCLNIAKQQERDFATRSFFYKEADIALSLYTEKCDISQKVMDDILSKREQITNVSQSMQGELEIQAQHENENYKQINEEHLKELDLLKKEMDKVESQSEFDKVLGKVNELENSLHKEAFTAIQQEKYNSISREYSALVSQIMQQLSRKNDIEYNKQASQDFKYVFDEFRNNERQYKRSMEMLAPLVKEHMFVYDSIRLYSETLVYFNYIYSYIFGKLDDDGKFNLTEWSITSNKK